MKNAQDVLAEMNRWHGLIQPLDGTPRTPENTLKYGMTWLHNHTYGEYQAMQVESSKQAHFRQLFTVWKAVCNRLKGWDFEMPAEQAILLFPAYIERNLPDVFVGLLERNIFLGVKFTDLDKVRHSQLKQRYVRQTPQPKRTQTPYASTYNR